LRVGGLFSRAVALQTNALISRSAWAAVLEILAFIASWLAVVSAVYIANKRAVKCFVVIYWRSETLIKLVESATKRLRFLPLKVYLPLAVALFALPVFVAMPLIAPDGSVQALPGFALSLLLGTLNSAGELIRGVSVSEAAGRSAGLVPIIPGFTLPWEHVPYLALAIATAVVAHELMHGYAALRHGVRVRSVGVFSVFYIVSGAFVEPDEDSFKKCGLRAKAAILTSGVAANVALAMIIMLAGVACASLGLYGAVMSAHALGLQPGDRVVELHGCGMHERVYSPEDFLLKLNTLAGVGPLLGVSTTARCSPHDRVTLVVYRHLQKLEIAVDGTELIAAPRVLWLQPNGSLYAGGVRPGDVIKRIEGCGVSQDIGSAGELLSSVLELRERCRPGDTLRVLVERDGARVMLNITLVEHNGRAFFGLGPRSLPLLGYDEGPLSREKLRSSELSKLVFWLVVVNYSLAVLNALPVYPLDGGQLLYALLRRRFGERFSKAATGVVSAAFATMIAFNASLGVLGEQYRPLLALR